MSGNTNNSPMLKAVGLRSKTSVKGGWYLTGRFGGVNILVMENRDRQGDDDPSHHLFFAEAPDRRQGATERPQEHSGGAGATNPPRTPSQALRSGFQGHRGPDHQAPLHRDGQQPARDVLDEVPEWAR